MSAKPTQRTDRWLRGYYCAVAVALREDGPSTLVRSLFTQGGDPLKADASDIVLFREHGLLPKEGEAEITHIVVAKNSTSWWTVVATFDTVPERPSYPFIRAAWSDAKSKSSETGRQHSAFILRAPVGVGREFSHLSDGAVEIDDEYHLAARKAAGVGR